MEKQSSKLPPSAAPPKKSGGGILRLAPIITPSGTKRLKSRRRKPPPPPPPPPEVIDPAKKCSCVSCKADQPTEDHTETDITGFLRLPEKLRVQIFRLLPIRDRLRLQRVCRQFRFDIRVRTGTAGFIDENTFWSVTLCRDVVVDTIAVGRFHNPPQPPSSLIYRPENVRHLIFTGPISITYVDAFLRRCRDSTTRLTFRGPLVEKSPWIPPPPPTQNSSLSNRTQLNQKNLKQFRRCDAVRKSPTKLHKTSLLEIFPPSFHRSAVPPEETLKNITDSVRFSSLTHLVVSTGTTPIKMDQVRQIHLAVFSFVMHNPTLVLLAIDTRIQHNNCDDDNNAAAATKPTSLKPEREVSQVSKQVQLDSLILTEEVVDFHLWNSFQILQKKLRVVQVMHLTNYPVVAFMVRNNAATLTKLAFHCLLLQIDFTNNNTASSSISQQQLLLRPKSDVNLDLALFSQCPNLKELFVCVAGPYHPLTTDVINFGSLPASLEVLALRNVLCSASDLLDLLSLPNLRNVGLVTFPSAGTDPSHYLNSTTLRRILHSRYLDELLLQGFTLPLDGVEEVYFLASEVGALYSGILNAVHLCDEAKRATRKNRWILANNNTFVFQLFDRHIFAK